MFSFWKNPPKIQWILPSKIESELCNSGLAYPCACSGNTRSQFLSFENLYSLFDTYVPNTSLQILIVF